MSPRGFHIRRFRTGDAEAVSELACRVFDEHVAPTFEPEGIVEMHDHLRAEAIAERAQTHLTLVALVPEPDSPPRMVGVIELRGGERVSMLFVATPHMGQGIATELMARAEAASRAAGSATMTVHSSLNAENFYRRLGFAPTDVAHKVYGFAYMPMERHLR
jgi:predicted N-acetyltransferase YhbS